MWCWEVALAGGGWRDSIWTIDDGGGSFGSGGRQVAIGQRVEFIKLKIGGHLGPCFGLHFAADMGIPLQRPRGHYRKKLLCTEFGELPISRCWPCLGQLQRSLKGYCGRRLVVLHLRSP